MCSESVMNLATVTQNNYIVTIHRLIYHFNAIVKELASTYNNVKGTLTCVHYLIYDYSYIKCHTRTANIIASE